MTGQEPNQHTKNLMTLFSELITVFESGTQKHVIVPCYSATQAELS